jgi:hypothetical protein
MEMEKYLKKFTRAEFEATNIGAEVAACTDLYDTCDLPDSVGYDPDFHPRREHMVFPENEHKLSSYYAIGGRRWPHEQDWVVKFVLGNAWPDINVPGEMQHFGTDYDCIEMTFHIGKEEIFLTTANKFRCEEAVPQEAGLEADKFFAENDTIVALLKAGHLVNFMDMKQKTRQWAENPLKGNSALAFKAVTQAGLVPDEIFGARMETREALSCNRRDNLYKKISLSLD